MNATGSCGCCACLGDAGEHLGAMNRPGLSAIHYRAGTYGTFLDTMVRALPGAVEALTTREPDDPAMALLDAWAVAGDVLTFYQERIATEGYLRTATERRSILELGRLVDYRLKPGVASSVHLAYTLDDDARTTIAAGSKAQSIPARRDEQAQMFETSEDIEARGAWNALKPRTSRPQRITIDQFFDFEENGVRRSVLVDNVLTITSVWIDGTDKQFQPRDPLLFVFDAGETYYAIRRVVKAVPDTEQNRTELQLEPVRPYYTALYLAVLQAIASPTTLPAAEVLAAAPARAAAKTKKKVAAKTVALATSGTGNAPPNLLTSLKRQILLATPRSALPNADFPEGVRAALTATDDEPSNGKVRCAVPTLTDFLKPLTLARGAAPISAFDFARSLKDVRNPGSDYRARLLTAFRPQLGTTLYGALANLCTGEKPYEQLRGLFVLRRSANVFGYNAPGVLFEDRPADSQAVPPPFPAPFTETASVLHLDTADEAVTTGSYAVTRNQSGTRVSIVTEVETGPLTAYGISGRSTTLTLRDPWVDKFDAVDGSDKKISLDNMKKNLVIIRTTSVLAESEPLTLAQQPCTRPVGMPSDEDGGESETRIELDAVVEGLAAGHRIIVRGKRVDTGGTHGVVAAELAMIDNVEQHTDAGPDGTAHSVLVLAPKGLAFQYERSSVAILGNIAPATHGDSQFDILGGGDASKAMQTFKLRHAPLTFVSAPTVEGVRSTLAVRVNDVLWHETDSLADAGPADRVFVTKTGDDDKVSITFGDGRHGQRLFTGSDNVRAAYRNGIGHDGNVRAGQIATAISRAAGVRDVINPIEASGGGDRESRDDARRNIPVSLQAMGRVVSVSDFADFARTFGGIAKATASSLSDGRRRFVHLTIGGTGDIDIDETSDLFRNLGEALRKYGDPYQPFVVKVREKLVMTGSARVRVGPDYLWALVAPKIRAALLDTFSYDRRDFGQPIYAAEVIATIQSVPGVVYVDLDELAGIRFNDILRDDVLANKTAFAGFQFGVGLGGGFAPPPTTPPKACDSPSILPHFACVVKSSKASDLPQYAAAEIAYLPPELADLFILTEIKA